MVVELYGIKSEAKTLQQYWFNNRNKNAYRVQGIKEPVTTLMMIIYYRWEKSVFKRWRKHMSGWFESPTQVSWHAPWPSALYWIPCLPRQLSSMLILAN